jgi:hypothetical protein
VRPPTDYELLNAIYKRHRADFEAYSTSVPGRSARIMIPIDIPAIAQQLGVDVNSVFGRLYYHLDPTYGEPATEGDKGRKAFFTPVPGDNQNCVNFPLLEAVLAGPTVQRRRDLWAIRTSLFSLGIAFASLLVAILR